MSQLAVESVSNNEPSTSKKPRSRPRQKAKAKSPSAKPKKSTSRSSIGARSNGTDKRKNGNGNGNGHARLTMAELKVAHAELVGMNKKLAEAVASLTEELRNCHGYLDVLHVPFPEGARLPDRVVAGIKLWFTKRGGAESSDHVSATLRKMLLAAGEWRCLYPGAYVDDDATL